MINTIRPLSLRVLITPAHGPTQCKLSSQNPILRSSKLPRTHHIATRPAATQCRGRLLQLNTRPESTLARRTPPPPATRDARSSIHNFKVRQAVLADVHVEAESRARKPKSPRVDGRLDQGQEAAGLEPCAPRNGQRSHPSRPPQQALRLEGRRTPAIILHVHTSMQEARTRALHTPPVGSRRGAASGTMSGRVGVHSSHRLISESL